MQCNVVLFLVGKGKHSNGVKINLPYVTFIFTPFACFSLPARHKAALHWIICGSMIKISILVYPSCIL